MVLILKVASFFQVFSSLFSYGQNASIQENKSLGFSNSDKRHKLTSVRSVLLLTFFLNISLTAISQTNVTGVEEENSSNYKQQMSPPAPPPPLTFPKLLFNYDEAGNQIIRQYCHDFPCDAGRNSSSTDSIINFADLKGEQLNNSEELISSTTSVTIYPNPVQKNIHLELISNTNDLISNLYVFNNLGVQLIKIDHVGEKQIDLNLNQLPSGTYIVHLHLSDNSVVTKKIIKF